MKRINFKLKDGAVFIELALVMPILLLLVAGIVQFGFILNAKVAVNSASYEAARAATLAEDPVEEALSSVQNYASSTLPGWDFSERLKANVDISGTEPGDIVKVEVIYSIPVFFSKILPLPGSESGYADVCGVSVMRVEEKE